MGGNALTALPSLLFLSARGRVGPKGTQAHDGAAEKRKREGRRLGDGPLSPAKKEKKGFLPVRVPGCKVARLQEVAPAWGGKLFFFWARRNKD